MISSTLMTDEYERLVTDYQSYVERQVAASIRNVLEEMSGESEPVAKPGSGKKSEPGVAPAAAHDAETS
jgi:hypothetical protein